MNTPLELFCTTGGTVHLRDIDDSTKELALELAPQAMKLHAFDHGPFYRRAAIILDVFKQPPMLSHTDCDDIQPLSWIGDSCFIDSVLIALFAVPTKFIQEHILDAPLTELEHNKFNSYPCSRISPEDDLKNRKLVQFELQRIALSLHGEIPHVETCTDLRNALINCPHVENYHEEHVGDAGEFLGYILGMFPNIHQVTTWTFEERSNDGGVSWTHSKPTKYTGNNNVITHINSNTLKSLGYPVIHDLLYSNTIYTYDDKVVRKVEKITSTPFLVVAIDRADLEEGADDPEFIDVSVMITETLNFHPFGQTLALTAVVLWENYHYTCVYKCGHYWYYYDDMSPTIDCIGTFEELRTSTDIPNLESSCTLLFYG